MAAEKPETDGFLGAIEAKLSALVALKESYLRAVSVGAVGQPGDADMSSLDQSVRGGAFELPSQALVGKSIPAAVKLYLSSVKKKLTVREITTALKDGGVESTAASFENTVTSALHRLKASNEVLKFKDGWADPSVVPPSMRHRIVSDDDTAARKRARTSKRASKAKAAREKKPGARKAKKAARSARRPAEMKAEKAKGPGLEQQINAYLQTRGNEFTTVQELANQLKVPAQVLNLTLGKMTKAEKIERNQNRLVRLTKKAA
jgi:hypothetical protein